MKLNQGSIILILSLWNFLPFGFAEISCGNLKVEYVNNANSINCKIQLFPSFYMRTYSANSKLYRWVHTQNSKPRVILQKNYGTYDTMKYGEDNYTLLIHNLGKSDEGRYQVHCWTDNNFHFFSPEVTVNIPADIPTTTHKTDTDTGLGTTSLIVILVCAVLIVAVITGPIFVIIHRRHGGQKGTNHFVNEDNTSGNKQRLKNEESVETDTNKTTTDYADLNENAIASAAHLGKTTSQPLRPENVFESENEYVLVKETGAVAKDSAAEYEVLLLRSQENKEENNLNVYVNGCLKKLDEDFSTVSVTGTDTEQGGKPLVKVRTGPTAEKSKRDSLSRISLQYALLDLATPENVTPYDRLYLSTSQPCQYSSIDLEKKAFVAHFRKSSSSSCERRNKNGEGND